MSEFSFDYFEDEVREGFYVSSIMKRAWAAQIDVLHTIDEICKRHNISWFSDSGTLLGAVRHKGYIPWDDDLDISMMRSDYEKFIKVAEAELPEGYVLNTPYHDNPLYELFGRVTYVGGMADGTKSKPDLQQFPFLVGVDIFPLDNIPDDPSEEKARLQMFRGLGGVLYAIDSKQEVDFEGVVREIESLTNYHIDRNLPPRQIIYICLDLVAKLYEKQKTKEVAVMSWYSKDPYYKAKRKSYEKIIQLPFETGTINCPIGYDDVLKGQFRDYMKLVKDGGTHSYPFFKTYIERIIHDCGAYAFQYKFDENDIHCEEREYEKTLSCRVHRFVDMTGKVLNVVADQLGKNNISGLDKLLEACQTTAINIGELIERKHGLETKSVLILQQYCEYIFQLYSAIVASDMESIVLNFEGIEACINDIKNMATSELEARKEVVFLVYKPKFWYRYEKEWKKAKDAGYKITVISVPYYELKADLTYGELHCDIEGYPDDIEITGYSEYDFENNHPDMIYIQNPYDEYNRVVSVNPFFYARNLRKYTEQLIYIPYFEMGEIENARYEQTMEYFCRVPGVVCADKVLLSSEKQRQEYIDNLSALSGEEYRSIWEQKISVE